jgi:hypothetical protein
MKQVARICYKHWLAQSNVLFIIGGKSNNTDIFETLRAMGDALREHFSTHGATPLYGGRTWRAEPHARLRRLADTCEALGLPYRFFGFDSAISEVVNYAKQVDEWMKAGGRAQIAATSALPTGQPPDTAPRRQHHACPRRASFPYFVGIRIAGRSPRPGPRLRAQYPRRRVAPRHADQPRLLRRQRRFGTSPGRGGQVLKTPSATSRCSTTCAKAWPPGIGSTPASSTCRRRACATACRADPGQPGA